MMETRQNKSLRYLLGKLTEQETSEFEAQCFENDELFHEMTELENDLLLSYVRGELSADERQEFVAGYLSSPARRRKVEFMRALDRQMSGDAAPAEDRRPARLPLRSWSLNAVSGAVALIALALICWLAILNYRLKNELRQAQSQEAALLHAQQDLEAKLAALNSRLKESGVGVSSQPQPPGPPVMALNLAPGLSRSAGVIQQLALSPKASRVELNLYLENDRYIAYGAALQNTEGEQVWRKTAIKSHADSQGRRIVPCEIPSDVFRDGDYVLLLNGVTKSGKVEEDIAAYRFAIARR